MAPLADGKRYGVVGGDHQKTLSGLQCVQGLVTGLVEGRRLDPALELDIPAPVKLVGDVVEVALGLGPDDDGVAGAA
jgi:hypothetical protein